MLAFSDWLIKRAMRTPYRHLPGYMERYWLMPYNRTGFAARVHHILRSDSDRVFHDHPWPYLTMILRGAYTEVKPVFSDGMFSGESRKLYKEGQILFRPARSWHRLELPEGETTWTLFLTGPKVQKWGFLVEPRAKIYWREFLDEWEHQGTPDA